MTPRLPYHPLRLLVLFYYLLHYTVFGQTLPFHPYTTKDGLLSNSINTFFQDSRGYLWIGTVDGISVYNGQSFTNYTTADGLSGNFVTEILEDRFEPGTMWIVTSSGGLSKMAHGRFEQIRSEMIPRAGQVNSVVQGRSGALWCGTDSIPFLLQKGRALPGPNSSLLTNATVIGEDRDGFIWFQRGGGVLYYRPLTDTIGFIYQPSGSKRLASAFTLTPDGTLWIGLWDGTILQVQNRRIVARRRTSCSGMIALTYDAAGNLWFLSYWGLFTMPIQNFPDGSVRKYTVENGLLENTLRTVFIDREDNVWIGGNSRGVMKLADRSIMKFPLGTINPPYHRSVGAIDSRDHLWVIAEDSLLWEVWQEPALSGTGWSKFLHSSQFSRGQGQPNSVFCDAQGGIWVGNRKGDVACYYSETHASSHKERRLKLIRLLRAGVDYPSSGFPLCFIIDRKGLVWLSMGNIGLLVLDPSRKNPLVRVYGESEGVPKNYVRSIYEDRQGNIWVGSYQDGASKLSRNHDPSGKFHRLNVDLGSSYEHIYSLTEDKDGRMVFGTPAGIIVQEDERVFTRTVKEGLPSNRLLPLMVDPQGRLWLGTQVGLAWTDDIGEGTFHRKSELTGSAWFVGGTSHRGFYWFVTGEGLLVYDPSLESKAAAPPVYIASLQVSGKDVSVQPGLEFSYNENNIVLGFIGISFKDEGAITYRYRLKGIDADWQPPTRSPSVSYAALSPDEYLFEVKAINVDGVESSEPAELSFTVALPYWRRWWFYGLMGGSGVAVLFFIRRNKIQQLRRETEAEQNFSRRLIDSQEQERTRIATGLHDSIGQNLIIIKNRAELAKSESPAAHSQVDEIVRVASQAINEVREISYNLRPYLIDRLGLTKALQALVENMQQSTSVRFTTAIDFIDGDISSDAEIYLYRIIQEGINNIVKHSGASEAAITVEVRGAALHCSITDNGKGFDKEKLPDEVGFGMKGIAERVRILNGQLTLNTEPGKGTALSIEIPLTKASG